MFPESSLPKHYWHYTQTKSIYNIYLDILKNNVPNPDDLVFEILLLNSIVLIANKYLNPKSNPKDILDQLVNNKLLPVNNYIWN